MVKKRGKSKRNRSKRVNPSDVEILNFLMSMRNISHYFGEDESTEKSQEENDGIQASDGGQGLRPGR